MDIEKYKNKQLEILHELDRVCNENGINYYLAYGSCLGAVRHNGFIPWDDDIDVVITADEMRRLISVRDSFKTNYFLQCRETEKNWTFMRNALRDSSTACFTAEDGKKDTNHGVKIDIYVLYPCPDDFFKLHKLIIDSYILRLLYMKKCNETPRNHGKIAKVLSKIIVSMYSGRSAEKKIKKIENDLKYNGGKNYYSVFFGNDVTFFSCLKFPAKMFKKPKYIKFEDFKAPCPSNPELMCKICYGDSYMEYPPIEDRKSSHGLIYVNCDEPYSNFEGKYYYKNRRFR